MDFPRLPKNNIDLSTVITKINDVGDLSNMAKAILLKINSNVEKTMNSSSNKELIELKRENDVIEDLIKKVSDEKEQQKLNEVLDSLQDSIKQNSSFMKYYFSQFRTSVSAFTQKNMVNNDLNTLFKTINDLKEESINSLPPVWKGLVNIGRDIYKERQDRKNRVYNDVNNNYQNTLSTNSNNNFSDVTNNNEQFFQEMKDNIQTITKNTELIAPEKKESFSSLESEETYQRESVKNQRDTNEHLEKIYKFLTGNEFSKKINGDSNEKGFIDNIVDSGKDLLSKKSLNPIKNIKNGISRLGNGLLNFGKKSASSTLKVLSNPAVGGLLMYTQLNKKIYDDLAEVRPDLKEKIDEGSFDINDSTSMTLDDEITGGLIDISEKGLDIFGNKKDTGENKSSNVLENENFKLLKSNLSTKDFNDLMNYQNKVFGSERMENRLNNGFGLVDGDLSKYGDHIVKKRLDDNTITYSGFKDKNEEESFFEDLAENKKNKMNLGMKIFIPDGDGIPKEYTIKEVINKFKKNSTYQDSNQNDIYSDKSKNIVTDSNKKDNIGDLIRSSSSDDSNVKIHNITNSNLNDKNNKNVDSPTIINNYNTTNNNVSQSQPPIPQLLINPVNPNTWQGNGWSGAR